MDLAQVAGLLAERGLGDAWAVASTARRRHAVAVLPWVAVRVFHHVTADDLGVTLVPWPVELGDEIAFDGHPWPLEVVDLVWSPPGARVAAIVKVRAALLHAV